MEIFIWTAVPCLVMICVSYAYFKADLSGSSLGFRVATSAHGASAAGLYLCAMLVSTFERNQYIAAILLGLYLVPSVLIIISLQFYRGPSAMHALQVLNVPVILYTAFIGLVRVAVGEI